MIAESNFTDQKLKMEYEAKRLEMEEKVAKSQVRANILDLLDMPPLEGEEDAKGRNIVHNKQMTDTNIALDRQHENWKEFIPGKKYHYSNSIFEMESQVILLLITIASLGKSQKLCVSYLSNRGHQKLILMSFQGILSNITTSWKY